MCAGKNNFCFNPRPQKGATTRDIVVLHPPEVSIHAPKRERHPGARKPSRVIQFQSTPPKGSDEYKEIVYKGETGFNPRPQKGATNYSGEMLDTLRVSIHAPKRERQELWELFLDKAEFQSTPPKGSDGGQCEGKTQIDVSIHAPKRERPVPVRFFRKEVHGFNPRPQKGATILCKDFV